MGYRHYFYKVKKADVEAVKDMSYNELLEYAQANNVAIDEWDGEEYLNFLDSKFLNQVEVHEFGKLYWDDTAERIYNKGVPLFTNKETQEQFDDYAPYVVGKDGVLEAISIYQEKVLNYYKDLLVDGEKRRIPFGVTLTVDDVKSIDKVLELIRDKIVSITRRGLADIDEKNKWQVTRSWEYEHSIFNLVHILKSVDWETETILFYGW
jgi:hypothetical protein